MTWNKFGISTLLSVVLGLLAIGVSFAQDTQPTPLPTQACAEWRELIREQLSQGWNEQQIKDYFVERFGDRVLATPPPRGLNWLVYVIPPLAFGAGAFLLYRAFVSWRNSPSVEMDIPEKEIETANEPYVEQLEEELKKL